MKKLLILLACLATLVPLFHTGLFDVHDPTSIVRFYTLQQTLRAGQWPAAWTNLLNQGYGYPIFLYYAPAFSYLGVLFRLLTPTYLLALKLTIGLLVITAGLGMYQLMRRFVSPWGAVVSALAYTLLPYHASTLYVRGAYAEGVTWALLPWLLYAWSSRRSDKKWLAGASVVTSLFFLSHNVLPFAFLPFLILWILLFHRADWSKILFAFILTIGLSAWFLAPVLFERGLIQVDKIAEGTRYSDHFLYPVQLWNSPWGYGGSAPMGQVDGMSFMLGKFQVVLSGLALIFLAYKKKWDFHILFFLTVTLFYAWMTTYLSAPVWSLVNGLAILQFPWRLLAFASFGVAALCGYVIEYVPKKVRLVSLLAVLTCILFFNLKFFVPERYITYTDADFLSQEKLDTTAADKIPEYLPAKMSVFPPSHETDGLDRTPTDVSGHLTVTEESPLLIQIAYMPQWQLTVDGNLQPVRASSTGLVTTQTSLSPGNHTIRLTWHATSLEKYSDIFSLVTGLVVIGLLL